MPGRNRGEKSGRIDDGDPWFPGLDGRIASVLLMACGIKRSEAKGINASTLWKWEYSQVRARESSKLRFVQANGLDREHWEEVEGLVLRLEKKRSQRSQFVFEPQAETPYQLELRLNDLVIELLKSNGELQDQIAGLRAEVQRLSSALGPRKVGRPKRGPAKRSPQPSRTSSPDAP